MIWALLETLYNKGNETLFKFWERRYDIFGNVLAYMDNMVECV